jgi:5-(carboxyamino)imidazole ribonucleotide synthase
VTIAPLLPGATIGILGGGQLGRMMATEARRMGYRIIALDPYARCPTAQVADGIVVGALDDIEAARLLAKQVDVITLDTEHVPAAVLDELEKLVPVRPRATVLRTIQDRQTQKQFLDSHALPQAAWAPATTPDELLAALAKLGRPAIVKVRTAGYDGKGQVRVDGGDVMAQHARLRGAPAVAEELVRFTREISVVLARAHDGERRIYPIAENVHRHHILYTTRAPAPMTDALKKRA